MKNPNEMIEMENLLELPSVGCVIDLDEQIVYPLFENGALDLGMGVEVSELDEEWVKALSWEEVGMLNNSGIYFE
jgi:hypothetical protein